MTEHLNAYNVESQQEHIKLAEDAGCIMDTSGDESESEACSDCMSDEERCHSQVRYQSDSRNCSEIELPHMQKSGPVMWHSNDVRELYPDESKVTEDGYIVSTFSLRNCQMMLRNFVLTVSVPGVEVKPEYVGKVAIEWNSLPHNLVKSAILRVNDIELERLDPHKMDFSSFLSKSGNSTGVDMSRGSTAFSVNFIGGSTLEPMLVSCRHPWHYSIEANKGYPLFTLGHDKVLSHDYTLVRRPLELLKMELLNEETDQWEHVDVFKHGHMIRLSGAYEVTASVHGVNLHGIELKGLKEQYEEGVGCFQVVDCPSYTVLKDEVTDNYSIYVPINERSCFAIAWGIMNTRVDSELNVRSFYGGYPDARSEHPYLVQRSVLNYAKDNCVKFDLLPKFTSSLLPQMWHEGGHPWYGLHLFNFTELRSTGYISADMKSLGAILRIDTCLPTCEDTADSNQDRDRQSGPLKLTDVTNDDSQRRPEREESKSLTPNCLSPAEQPPCVERRESFKDYVAKCYVLTLKQHKLDDRGFVDLI